MENWTHLEDLQKAVAPRSPKTPPDAQPRTRHRHGRRPRWLGGGSQ
ncbi:hypothetical protein O2V63_12715 [Modestobacter sp. VKM Ac-2977]|nr:MULTISPECIES: hypothetical protein [unclassified Modestobacter]MCZ2813650.1 hypothetical protein [Modestobacter sp. VKM Ac-2979]MCZ2821198.1 hypothetical protein [Modestobacter sp. VKM Ac-2977]MCZ2844375.1 hypothetical protein [Modestobacter sp. VKM Ac-2980]